MFPVRLILLVFATTLTCDNSLGGEPNDRISEILAVMAKINENVDGLKGKVNGIEKTVSKLEDKVDGITKEISEVGVEKINGYKFVGKGLYKTHDTHFYKEHTTMKGCLEYCQFQRLKLGSEW